MSAALLEQELKILIVENDDLKKENLQLIAKIRHLEEQLYNLSDLLNNVDSSG